MVVVDRLDVGSDRPFQLFSGAVDAAADLLFGDGGEEALDQIDPGAGGRGEVNMPSRSRAEPLSDRRRLVGGVVVHDQAHFEFGRDIALDLAQEAQELASAMTRIATPDDLAGRCVQRRNDLRYSHALNPKRIKQAFADPIALKRRQEELIAACFRPTETVQLNFS